MATTETTHRGTSALADPEPQADILRVYLLERRRALLAELAALERLLGIKRPIDKQR